MSEIARYDIHSKGFAYPSDDGHFVIYHRHIEQLELAVAAERAGYIPELKALLRRLSFDTEDEVILDVRKTIKKIIEKSKVKKDV
jgi:hypothetical protein